MPSHSQYYKNIDRIQKIRKFTRLQLVPFPSRQKKLDHNSAGRCSDKGLALILDILIIFANWIQLVGRNSEMQLRFASAFTNLSIFSRVPWWIAG